jgi:uncharacterized protein
VFVRRILGNLSRAGLVASQPGAGGGRLASLFFLLFVTDIVTNKMSVDRSDKGTQSSQTMSESACTLFSHVQHVKENIMKIALFGASGTIGQRITLEALVRGHEVKALVRNLEGFPIAHPRLTIAKVDMLDHASIAGEIADADVVVNATSGHKNPNARTFFLDSTHALIEGVKLAGGKRLIVVGGAGSLEVAPGMLLVNIPEFREEWKPTANAQAETLVMYRSSDIDWTFFSPSALIMPGKRTGKYHRGTDQLLKNDQGESYISAEDYAFALLDEIEYPQAIRQRFTAVSLEK